MAENKKSFIAYVDWKETFDSLPDDKAGQLVKHLFSYVNDENPSSDDILINAVFANIKHQLKRDLKIWENTRKVRAEVGKLGGINSGESRRSKQTKQLLKKRSKTKQNEANEAVNVNVIVNDNVNEDNKVSAKNAERDFIDQIVQLFVEAHGDYLIVNNGEERKAASKILGIYKKKYPAATSEETLKALKQYFFECVNISDAWLKTNMSLPIIVSKFNQISKILKNGTAKKPGATFTDIARITLEKFPEQFIKD
jgi:hypothetical protein